MTVQSRYEMPHLLVNFAMDETFFTSKPGKENPIGKKNRSQLELEGNFRGL
jgi:hypothetical protein